MMKIIPDIRRVHSWISKFYFYFAINYWYK